MDVEDSGKETIEEADGNNLPAKENDAEVDPKINFVLFLGLLMRNRWRLGCIVVHGGILM